jgi:hypothetical protein
MGLFFGISLPLEPKMKRRMTLGIFAGDRIGRSAIGFCRARLVHRGVLSATCVAMVLAGLVTTGWTRDVYSWSANVAVAPFDAGRQQGETALVTDSNGRVWLSFIDAEYKKTATGIWIAFPRSLRLFMSADAGKSFTAQPNLSTDSAGDQALASDLSGRAYASFVNYFTNPSHQQIVLRRLDAAQDSNSTCLPWDASTKHDQSNVHIGREGTIHVLGVDIQASPNPGGKLLYARSTDGGKTCVGQRRLQEVGELPQILDTQFGLLIAGAEGYYTSADRVAFSARIAHRFGAELTRLAVSPDGRAVYAVGDSTGGGLQMQTSADGGKTWRTKRVDDAPRATAWRYPAVHVDPKGRVHVAWMDDRAGFGAIYHAYSDDAGATFSPNTRLSDKTFPFPANAPPPPPATQNGTWVGDYLSLTTVGDLAIVAWSDQRAGTPKSVVEIAVGSSRSQRPLPPAIAPLP